jgi:copper chaperone CopZ
MSSQNAATGKEVNPMKTTIFLVSWVLIGSMIWGGTVEGAAPSQEATPASPTGEVITLKIEGWTCASCEKDIRRALLAVPGVNRAEVSYARGGVIVEIERGRVSNEQLVQAVASAGNILSSYRASVVPNGALTAENAGHQGAWSQFWNLLR